MGLFSMIDVSTDHIILKFNFDILVVCRLSRNHTRGITIALKSCPMFIPTVGPACTIGTVRPIDDVNVDGVWDLGLGDDCV
jgi:hypothetical protein